MLNLAKIRNEIKDRKVSPEFEVEILDLLEKKKEYIEKLRSEFDSKRTMKYSAYIKRKFPLFND